VHPYQSGPGAVRRIGSFSCGRFFNDAGLVLGLLVPAPRGAILREWAFSIPLMPSACYALWRKNITGRPSTGPSSGSARASPVSSRLAASQSAIASGNLSVVTRGVILPG